MRYLLDTHVLLWGISEPERLSAHARAILEDPNHDFAFSAVNLWEITIKHALGRADFTIAPQHARRIFLAASFEEVSMTSMHAIAVGRLPLLHRDPFDRLLLAQATVEEMTLLTSDKQIAAYEGPVLLV